MTQRRYQLDATTPSQVIQLQGWGAAMMLVSNPTGSPVALRLGGNDVPSSSNYDELCAGGGYLLIPVSGADFAAAFTQPSLASSIVSANLGTKCSITLMTADEQVPNFGAASFQSLSTSELLPITNFTGVTTRTEDIGSWGGALVYVNPDSGSGQGVITISASSDGLTYRSLGTFAFWPNVPAIVVVARVARYLRVVLNATAIVGEPAISGQYAIRATIAEVQNLAYNPGSQAIAKTFALAASGSQQFQFVTVGLPAVSLAAIATVGTGASAAVTLLVEASSDLINWRQVTFRTQRMSQGITLYRALGNLDLFIRVTVFEVSGVSALNGTLYLSIPREADLGSILNTIQQSLGDTNAPTNTNQDIYHELDNIRLNVSASGSIFSKLNDIYGAVVFNHSDLQAILGQLATLTTISSQLTTANNWLDTIDNDLIAFLYPQLVNIASYTQPLNTSLGTIITQLNALSTISSQLTGLQTSLTALTTVAANISYRYGTSTAIGVAGVWINTGVDLTVGQRIVEVEVSSIFPAANVGGMLAMAVGSTVAAITEIWRGEYITETTGGPQSKPTGMRYGGHRGSGLPVATNVNRVWVLAGAGAPLTFTWNVVTED